MSIKSSLSFYPDQAVMYLVDTEPDLVDASPVMNIKLITRNHFSCSARLNILCMCPDLQPPSDLRVHLIRVFNFIFIIYFKKAKFRNP